MNFLQRIRFRVNSLDSACFYGRANSLPLFSLSSPLPVRVRTSPKCPGCTEDSNYRQDREFHWERISLLGMEKSPGWGTGSDAETAGHGLHYWKGDLCRYSVQHNYSSSTEATQECYVSHTGIPFHFKGKLNEIGECYFLTTTESEFNSRVIRKTFSGRNKPKCLRCQQWNEHILKLLHED